MQEKVQGLRDAHRRNASRSTAGKKPALEEAKEVDSHLEETRYIKDQGVDQMPQKDLMLNQSSSKSLLDPDLSSL